MVFLYKFKNNTCVLHILQCKEKKLILILITLKCIIFPNSIKNRTVLPIFFKSWLQCEQIFMYFFNFAYLFCNQWWSH